MLFTPWLDSVRNSTRSSLRQNRRHLALRRSKHSPQLLAEMLETRTLMTAPSFVSVSPNVGDFLQDGDVRTEVPREFVFQFSPGQTLNAATVGAIHVVGAGHDGGFTPANVVTDLGTNGAALLRIGSRRLEAGDNGATLTVGTANRNGNGPLVVSDAAGNLTLTLDSNVATPTTVQRLLDYAANDVAARQLLTVSLVSGNAATSLATATPATSSLSGAGAASAVSSLGAAGLNVLFTATITTCEVHCSL